MHAVVLGRQLGEAGPVCEPVARWLGRALTELRSRLALVGDEPIVLSATRDPDAARAAADVLEAHGFGASVLDVRAPFATLVAARAFVLGPEAIVVTAADRSTIELAWADVDAIVAGTVARPEPHRGLVPLRTAHTGAHKWAQPVLVREEPVASPGEEQLVFVVSRDRAIVLGEDHLEYRSLGAEVKPSRGANFRHVVQVVREHRPAAPYDHRLEHPHVRAHILGPTTALDRGLALAAAIVAGDLRRSVHDPYR